MRCLDEGNQTEVIFYECLSVFFQLTNKEEVIHQLRTDVDSLQKQQKDTLNKV